MTAPLDFLSYGVASGRTRMRCDRRTRREKGEAVKVVTVRKEPNLTRVAVIQHCKTQLTDHKVPRHIEFRELRAPPQP